ncbi:MAG: indolepyruvate ferredoxin oxidoreductase subunit alpha [Armatimonadota bacterium]|nr:indolepyruvate ferredoxin oxidoreductase subunit alpha [Armatimonadota bacterium]
MERVQERLLSENSTRKLFLGNEAIVRGALEAGLDFAAAYPGTPSSEIADLLAELSAAGGPRFVWAVNEKVALEMAAAAAASGLRALTAMKHVGLNVAADALMSVAYTGTRGGFVIVTADDPSCHSSQNEQDNRYYARLAGIPMLEPSSPQEALEMTRAAFLLSEELLLPVLLRITTRVAHTRSPVTTGPLHRPRGEFRRGRFLKDPGQWVVVPDVARQAHRALLAKLERAEEFAVNSAFNTMHWLEGKGSSASDAILGILSSGVARAYVREALEEILLQRPLRVLFLEVGFSYPTPRALLREFLERVERVLVVEELEPLLEQEVRALAGEAGYGVPIYGKLTGHLPRFHEFRPELVEEAIWTVLEPTRPRSRSVVPSGATRVQPPPRPPVLCPGCPHRHTYYAAHRAARVVARRLRTNDGLPIFPTDIGCYTLGLAKPYEMADYLLCMGSSVGSGCGFSVATDQPVLSFIGDSTFFHAGLPALVQAVHHNSPLTLVVLDNGTTAMTGHQPHPGAGGGKPGAGQVDVSIEETARGMGVQWIRVVDPNDLQATQRVIEEAMLFPGPSVVVARAPCILQEVAQKRRKGEAIKPYTINPERCTACMVCVRRFACPAILAENGVVWIDPEQCTGCGVCAQVCPKDAVVLAPLARDEGGEVHV